ncbi:hypothetical protein [Eggerthella timonensis]|uniref:hypothetical protein n=1 Tax=Eggerthella timonensis TaxID=1871008 RepID=UPI000C75EE25|nr:hypothetical protein [Eggerthella timonensis]
MNRVFVHPRVMERHPDLSEADVLAAWEGCERWAQRRASNASVAVGFDARGRFVEMVAARSPDGDWLIYHAMTPPSKKVLAEVRLKGR